MLRIHTLILFIWFSAMAGPALLLGEELTLRKTLRHPTGRIMQIAFGPDGKMLLSAGALDNVIRLWDVDTQEHVQIHTSHSVAGRSGVFDVALSPDGNTVASAGIDQRIVLWDVATAMSIRPLEFEGFNVARSLAFSPDGKLLASGNNGDRSDMARLTLWDVASGTIKANLESNETQVLSVAFSLDGKLLASGTGARVKLWDVATGKCLKTFEERVPIKALAFSPDGTIIAFNAAVGVVPGSLDYVVRLQDVAHGKVTVTLTGHTGGVECLAFSPDGKLLASGDARGNMILWDVASSKARVRLPKKSGDSVDSVAFSPDGKTLATATSPNGRGEIKLWDVEVSEE